MDVSVWPAPQDTPACAARWVCREHERVYLVRAWGFEAHAAPARDSALAALRREH